MGAAFLKIGDWNLRRHLQPKTLRVQRGSTAREAGHQHNLRRFGSATSQHGGAATSLRGSGATSGRYA
jgi:hypothetical protein